MACGADHAPPAPRFGREFTMVKDYRVYEERLAASYRKAAEQYRRDDEVEVGTANHRRICGNLGRLSSSFGRKIRALDVGCGTGRYFHCLESVEVLVGVDISAEMLRAAEKPVKGEEVSAASIRLLQRNVYEHTFAAGTFDLIYSFGMFGHGAPLTVELCRKFHEWLGDGGCLYLDTIETANDPLLTAARRRLRNAVYPFLPRRARRKLDERQARLPVFTMTPEELEAAVHGGGFRDFTVSNNVCHSPLWSGTHLECVATKGRRQASAPVAAARAVESAAEESSTG